MIQEMLNDIQRQQLAQASFGGQNIHFYIVGYLLIGLVAGVLIFIYIHKKKQLARRSIRITQPHRFAVPSRMAQRSSLP